MIEWIFTVLVLYLLYKLIFDFILPVSKVSTQMRNKINEMNNRQQQNNTNNSSQQASAQTKTARPPKEDYIDFEEVK